MTSNSHSCKYGDKNMLSYSSRGSGDWKAEGKPANGYLLVEIEGIPYWQMPSDKSRLHLMIIGIIIRTVLIRSFAARNTIADGAQFANGSLWNLIFPSYDYSNTYDKL